MQASQASNLAPQPPAAVSQANSTKPGRYSNRDTKTGSFGDIMRQEAVREQHSTYKKHGANEQQATQAVEDNQAPTEQEDNLYAFPLPVDQEQTDLTDELHGMDKILVPHPSMFRITQDLVSILEGYPNNNLTDTEIKSLLEEYAQKLTQLEQPLSPKVAQLQSLIEEILARMPQDQSIVESSQQTDKFVDLIKMLRGNPSPLENVNEDIKAPADEAEALLKPIVGGDKKAATADEDSSFQQQQRDAQHNTTGSNQQQQFRVDMAPQRVFFADAQATANAAAPRFVPMTPESLFGAMIDRIVALPGADPHMEIALKPDHLGKLTIDLSLGEQGLTAKIIASDEGVRNMLAAHINRLSETLAEKGIRVENVEIVYSSLADKQSDGQQSNREEQGKNNSYHPPVWGVAENQAAAWDNAYISSPYTDEWGTSSVEYQA